MVKITLPLWMMAPTSAMDISDALSLATFKRGAPRWAFVEYQGVDYVLAFSSLQKARKFAAKAFPRPDEYINTEMDAIGLRRALEAIRSLPIERLLLDEKSAIPIAPIVESLKQHPESFEDFGRP